MKLILNDKSEIKIESYENITSGVEKGGVKIRLKDMKVDDIPATLENKLSEIKILSYAIAEIDEHGVATDSGKTVEETVLTAKNLVLGDKITKDTDSGIVEFSLVPKGLKDDVAQNTADITAINEAIADLASAVGGE